MHRRLPDGWAAWFLIAAAGLPLAAFARLSWGVMTGAADDMAVSGLPGNPPTGLNVRGARWWTLWSSSSGTTLLQVGLLALVVLAGITGHGHPRPFVPTGAGRIAATVVAAVATALGVACCVGFLAQLVGWLPSTNWQAYAEWGVDAHAAPVATVLATAVVGSAATVALWPRPSQEPDDEAAAVDTGDGTTPQDRVEEPPVPQSTVPEPQQRSAANGFPTPSASDLASYRRSETRPRERRHE